MGFIVIAQAKRVAREVPVKIRTFLEYASIPSATLIAVILSSCASTSPPTQTHDGLVLVPNTRFAQVFMRPGADLSSFTAFGLTPCEVAFRKNWQRDQNQSTINLNSRVTQEDVTRIKDRLGEECDNTFRAALEQAPAYNLLDDVSKGEPVLVLHPSIINLDIAAPDVMVPGRQRAYTTEAGEMTLVLEGVDATTGETLVRVVDRRRALDTGRLQWTNSVTNQADARRILNRWASQFREGLDEVTRRSAPP
jgi:Protein of unknown function (DUF3313)